MEVKLFTSESADYHPSPKTYQICNIGLKSIKMEAFYGI